MRGANEKEKQEVKEVVLRRAELRNDYAATTVKAVTGAILGCSGDACSSYLHLLMTRELAKALQPVQAATRPPQRASSHSTSLPY